MAKPKNPKGTVDKHGFCSHLILKLFTRNPGSPTNDEVILGEFSWDQWDAACATMDLKIEEIVRDVLPGRTWKNHNQLLDLYSTALSIMADDRHMPFRYVMLLRNTPCKCGTCGGTDDR